MSNPPAGWYPDVNAAGGERFWDGQQWTNQRRDGQGRVPVAVPHPGEVDSAGMSLEQWATIWSVLFPIVGLIQGIILLDRGSPKAKRIIIVSVVLMIVYATVGILSVLNPGS